MESNKRIVHLPISILQLYRHNDDIKVGTTANSAVSLCGQFASMENLS